MKPQFLIPQEEEKKKMLNEEIPNEFEHWVYTGSTSTVLREVRTICYSFKGKGYLSIGYGDLGIFSLAFYGRPMIRISAEYFKEQELQDQIKHFIEEEVPKHLDKVLAFTDQCNEIDDFNIRCHLCEGLGDFGSTRLAYEHFIQTHYSPFIKRAQ